MASLIMWRDLTTKQRYELYQQYRKSNPNMKYSDMEKDFNDWYKRVAEYKGLNPNPYEENQYYDYKSFYEDNKNRIEIPYALNNAERMLSGDQNSHFTDTYKLPGHPTFSSESIYSNSDTPGGKWVKDENNRWQFQHSDYTINYSDRTLDYLKGTDEYATYGGGYVLPEIKIYGKLSNSKVKTKKYNNDITNLQDNTKIKTKYIPELLPYSYSGEIRQGKNKQSNDNRTAEQRNRDYWDPIKGAFERFKSSLQNDTNPLIGLERTVFPAIAGSALVI